MFCRVGEDLTGLECDIDKDIDQGGGDWLVRLNRVLFLNTDQEWLGVLVSPRARPGRNGGVYIPVSECRRGSTKERIPPD